MKIQHVFIVSSGGVIIGFSHHYFGAVETLSAITILFGVLVVCVNKFLTDRLVREFTKRVHQKMGIHFRTGIVHDFEGEPTRESLLFHEGDIRMGEFNSLIFLQNALYGASMFVAFALCFLMTAVLRSQGIAPIVMVLYFSFVVLIVAIVMLDNKSKQNRYEATLDELVGFTSETQGLLEQMGYIPSNEDVEEHADA